MSTSIAKQSFQISGSGGSEPKTHVYKFEEPLGADRSVYLLILLMVLAYGLTFGLHDLAKSHPAPLLSRISDFLFLGGTMSSAFWKGQVWRSLTYAFLHAGLFHLLSNLSALWYTARICSVSFGRRGWLAIFLATSVMAGPLVALHYGSDQVMVGASIGIMGLIGAMIAAELRKRSIDRTCLPATMTMPLRQLLLLLLLQALIESLIPNVSHIGHVAGLLTGFFLGLVMPLNAGVKLLASRNDLIVVKRSQYSCLKARKTEASEVVEKIWYEVDTLRDGDFLVAVQKQYGIARFIRITSLDLVGTSPEDGAPAWENACLVADRFSVPVVDATIVNNSLAEDVLAKGNEMPLWQSLLIISTWLVSWRVLFMSWSADVISAATSLGWLQSLSGFLTGPLGSHLLALIVTMFAAMVLAGFFAGTVVSFVTSLVEGAKARRKAQLDSTV